MGRAAVVLCGLLGCAQVAGDAPGPDAPSDEALDPHAPRYKPSSSSPEPLPITSNAYGAFRWAPDAPAIGDRAPGFELPATDGTTFELSSATAVGPVVIVFYRGDW